MTETTMKDMPFSEKFRIAGERFAKRPLAERLALMVEWGMMTEAGRQRAIAKESRQKGSRAVSRKKR